VAEPQLEVIPFPLVGHLRQGGHKLGHHMPAVVVWAVASSLLDQRPLLEAGTEAAPGGTHLVG
jgi:hypothetical protein